LKLRLRGFWTRPIRIALAETLILQTVPLTTARTFWMFGLNLLLVMPVIFLPTPPRYLALPRLTMLLPKLVFFPVKKQTLDISLTPILHKKPSNKLTKVSANIQVYQKIASPKTHFPLQKFNQGISGKFP
jgi:hypothetical protein